MRVSAGILAALLSAGSLSAGPADAPPASLKERAQAAVARADYPEAIRLLEEARQRSPRDVDAALQLAELCSWTGDFDRSIVAFQNILALDASNLRARVGLASVYRWSHRYGEAEQLFEHFHHMLTASGDSSNYAELGKPFGFHGQFARA